MAITVNGQILRNLPEQVSKNTEDIIDLQDTTNLQGDKIAALENSIITDITLNNLEVTGNTVIGNAGSDTLTVTGASSFAGNVNVTGNVTASGALAAASASFTGNASIGGNLTVNGNINNTLLNNTEKVLMGSEKVVGYYQNEGDIAIAPSTSSITFPYAHWRVSNGKLNIVILCQSDGSEALSSEVAISTGNVNFDVPVWVYNSLTTNSPGNRLDTKLLESSIRENSGGSIFPENNPNGILISVIKTLTLGTLRIGTIYLETGSIPADGYARNYRYEANFIL